MVTYERVRLGERRHIVNDIAVGEVAIDMILTYLIEFTDKTVNGLSLRLSLLNGQTHRKKILQNVIQ